jgi:hypothetical protein
MTKNLGRDTRSLEPLLTPGSSRNEPNYFFIERVYNLLLNYVQYMVLSVSSLFCFFFTISAQLILPESELKYALNLKFSWG